MSSRLQSFHKFHSMVASPQQAKQCIQSLTHQSFLTPPSPTDDDNCASGCILFIPSSYKDNISNLNVHSSFSHSLNIFSYYLLVLISCTGISTLLGLTETICMEEYSSGKEHFLSSFQEGDNSSGNENHNDQNDSSKILLRSKVQPAIEIQSSILEYVQQYILQEGTHTTITKNSIEGNNTKEKTTTHVLALKRRFEYNFRLCGLNVIMLHIISYRTNNDDNSTNNIHNNSHSNDPSLLLSKDQERSNETLHLVEVYHFRNMFVRVIFGQIAHIINWIFGLFVSGFQGNDTSAKKNE